MLCIKQACKANGCTKAHYSTTDTGFYSTQEEGSPLCSCEKEEKYLSCDDESVQTDYVLVEVVSSSEDDDEDDDEDGDDIQITVTITKSGRRATRHLL